MTPLCQTVNAPASRSRAEKFHALNVISGFDDIEWEDGQSGWMDPFLPLAAGDYFRNPSLGQLMPWDQAGCMTGRTWVVDTSADVLRERWKLLVTAEPTDRPRLFKDSRTGRSANDRVVTRLSPLQGSGRIIDETPASKIPHIAEYGFRSFDRQRLFLDSRLLDRHGPTLWGNLSDQQIFLTTLVSEALSCGPAATTSPFVPDLNYFNNRGGRTIPLYRDTAASEANITHGMLEFLTEAYEGPVSPEDLISYVVGVIGHGGYTDRFHTELELPGPRVPISKQASLFRRSVDLGRQVIAWQTYGNRFPEAIGTAQGVVPSRSARVKVAIPDDSDGYPLNLSEVRYDEDAQALHIGEGVIDRVDPRIWEYEVSGLRVVRSWLGYRVKDRTGRRSSPLDDVRPERWRWEMTRELLELLWVLDGVIALEPAQADLLDEIIAADLFLADELPTPTDAEQSAPRVERQQQMGLDLGL